MDCCAQNFHHLLDRVDFLNYMLINRECLVRGSQVVRQIFVTTDCPIVERIQERFVNATVSNMSKIVLLYGKACEYSQMLRPIYERVEKDFRYAPIKFVEYETSSPEFGKFDYDRVPVILMEKQDERYVESGRAITFDELVYFIQNNLDNYMIQYKYTSMPGLV